FCAASGEGAQASDRARLAGSGPASSRALETASVARLEHVERGESVNGALEDARARHSEARVEKAATERSSPALRRLLQRALVDKAMAEHNAKELQERVGALWLGKELA